MEESKRFATHTGRMHEWSSYSPWCSQLFRVTEARYTPKGAVTRLITLAAIRQWWREEVIVACNSLGVTPCRLSAHKRRAARILEKKGKRSSQLAIRGQRQYMVVGSYTPEREEEKVHCCDWRRWVSAPQRLVEMSDWAEWLGGKGWQMGGR